jgi:hypothetical protein
LTDYQQNFDSNQKNLEKKEYLSKQTKQEAVYQEMKNKAKAQYNNKQQVLKINLKMSLKNCKTILIYRN